MDKQSFSGIYTDIHSLLHQFPLVCEYVTLWLFNVAMERSTIFKFGKPSIPWAIYVYIYHGYVSHIQRLSSGENTVVDVCYLVAHPT